MELLEVYDAAGRSLGLRPRSECHGNPELIHRTSHVVVFHPDGERLLLQKRSRLKDIQPGRWDTAVGGHLDPGEDYLTAARREAREEIGLPEEVELFVLFDTKIRNAIESEDVRVFGAVWPGPFPFAPEEIDEVRFWRREELRDPVNQQSFTPNLIAELERVLTLPWKR